MTETVFSLIIYIMYIDKQINNQNVFDPSVDLHWIISA